MSDYLTIRLITAAFRRDFPQTPASETFMVVHHQGDGAEICGTDEDCGTDTKAPECLDPIHWAQDIAAQRGVEFIAPGNIGFAYNRSTHRWYAFEQEETEGDGKQVWNLLAVTEQPILFVSRSRKAAA